MEKIKVNSDHQYCETLLKLMLRHFGSRVEESLWKLHHIYVGEELSEYIELLQVPFTAKGDHFYFDIDADTF